MPTNDVNETRNSYNLFSDLKTPRDLSAYTLFRGTTDFSQLQQFDLYESGYPYLVVVSIPKFLEKMAAKDESVKSLVNSYVHILEYEFKGLESGIDDLSSETGEISNGMQSMNVITKTTGISGTQFSMRYMEKSGSTLTKMHELYLRSVRDPATGFKTYNGLIGDTTGSEYQPSVGGVDPKGASTPGFEQECFSFLYMHTDNTGLALERAIYYVGCQPTSAGLSGLYSGQKGEVSFQEVTCEFNGFPITGSAVNARAKEILKHINEQTYRNSWDYEYAAIKDSSRLAKDSLTTPGVIYTSRDASGNPEVVKFLK